MLVQDMLVQVSVDNSYNKLLQVLSSVLSHAYAERAHQRLLLWISVGVHMSMPVYTFLYDNTSVFFIFLCYVHSLPNKSEFNPLCAGIPV